MPRTTSTVKGWGWSLGIGDQRILWLQNRILQLIFACFLRELCPSIIILLFLYNILSAANSFLHKNPVRHSAWKPWPTWDSSTSWTYANVSFPNTPMLLVCQPMCWLGVLTSMVIDSLPNTFMGLGISPS